MLYEQAAERARGRAERDEDDNEAGQEERAGADARGACAADDGDVAGEQRQHARGRERDDAGEEHERQRQALDQGTQTALCTNSACWHSSHRCGAATAEAAQPQAVVTTTLTLEQAIAAPAIAGFKRPAAASGISARL